MTCQLLFTLASILLAEAFHTFSPTFKAPLLARKSFSREAIARSSTTVDNDTVDQVSQWKAEAERMRLEAAQMDSALTKEKIASIERKLASPTWVEKHTDQVDGLQAQLQSLQNRLAGKSETTTIPKTKESLATAKISTSTNGLINSQSISSLSASSTSSSSKYRLEENPLSGFDQADLDLYVPVVEAIDRNLTANATLEEKLIAFRAAPELQDHFQEKIRQMIVQPMEDMQRLEELKQDYLASSSSNERKQIKREIAQLELTLENDGPFLYSDSIYLRDLPPLQEDEIQQRLQAVGSLHPVLQALYKKRCGLNETNAGEHDANNLRLAIQMDHYEPQLQLLEQVRYIEPINDETKHEIRIALLSLPVEVRNYFASTNLKLENGDDLSAMIEALVDGQQEEWLSLQEFMMNPTVKSGDDGTTIVIDGGSSSSIGGVDLPEYNDLDFMDRSRYVKEFLPSLVKLEMIHPSMQDIETLMKQVLDKKAFMVTEKPERVIGGYYIRGRNLLFDEETGKGNDELVALLQQRLRESSLQDKIDLFYIQDPTPPTDEEYELGLVDRPLLVVTAKNRQELYNWSPAPTKFFVSLLALCSIVLYSAAISEMQPLIRDQVEAAASGDLSVDLTPVFSNMALFTGTALAIQAVHEMGHRVVAARDKFEIGLPNLIPSIQLGLQGAITPFKSPPPSNKSMFDFAMAGPMAGLLLSIVLFANGLHLTEGVSMVDAGKLPAFPVAILRSSALGGGMFEYFIGKGSLMSAADSAVVPLHPVAIAGFVGILSNALALLPLGNTDGGRVAHVMFGRRGAYLVKIFTTLALCAAGLFGLDESRIFLTYILFTMIWQRDLEAPALNEADDLDFPRCVVGISAALLVFLSIIPLV